jgi:ubiquinone/menaquinone biosynthesis C-methylase UbiE
MPLEHTRVTPITPGTPAPSGAVETETAMVEFKGKVDASYLAALSVAVRRDKERSFELLDLAPGASVLDVGCGPATDTIALATRVGPEGCVVGVDFDPEMVALADTRAREAGCESTVTHRVADAMVLPFRDDTFDACRSERMFQHLPDPAGALAEMIRVTRPGGRVVVFDTDHFSVTMDSLERDIWQRLARYRCEHRITSPWATQQLYRLFREAGLTDLTVEPRSNAVLDLEFADLALGWEALVTDAVAAGVVTADEVARLRASMEADAASGTFFGYWTMILMAGTKSAA